MVENAALIIIVIVVFFYVFNDETLLIIKLWYRKKLHNLQNSAPKKREYKSAKRRNRQS